MCKALKLSKHSTTHGKTPFYKEKRWIFKKVDFLQRKKKKRWLYTKKMWTYNYEWNHRRRMYGERVSYLLWEEDSARDSESLYLKWRLCGGQQQTTLAATAAVWTEARGSIPQWRESHWWLWTPLLVDEHQTLSARDGNEAPALISTPYTFIVVHIYEKKQTQRNRQIIVWKSMLNSRKGVSILMHPNLPRACCWWTALGLRQYNNQHRNQVLHTHIDTAIKEQLYQDTHSILLKCPQDRKALIQPIDTHTHTHIITYTLMYTCMLIY